VSFIVREYRVGDAGDEARLAAMFNDFDSAWPGGFTRGSLETVEAIRERKARIHRLAILVAEEAETGDFVGYCDLDAQPGQKEKSYVDLLGARLRVHGQGVGKALILEAVRRSSEAGYREVTLYTWAGNTKAVPLYKKTGFNWVPDTDVYMRNFIPSVLATPAVKTFLARRDWYPLHQRDLSVAPDDLTWKGMKVFRYRLADDRAFVDLVYQADSVGLTAVATPDFSVSCTVPVEEAAAGQSYPVVWEIEPRGGRPVSLTLLAEADTGLDLRVQEQLTLSESTEIARMLRVGADAQPRRAGERTHVVRSTLLIDGQPITLETGVKVVRPIEILYGGQALFVGRRERIEVQLRNRLPRTIAGTLSLEPAAGVDCAARAQPFRVGPNTWTQCALDVTAREGGAHASVLRCRGGAEESCPQTAHMVADSEATSRAATSGSTDLEGRGPRAGEGSETDRRDATPVGTGCGNAAGLSVGAVEVSRPVTFRAFEGGEAIASIDTAYSETAVLESADVRVEIDLRGGDAAVYVPDRKRSVLHGNAQAGPPFAPDRMRPPLCSAAIEAAPGGVRLRISRPPDPVTGLALIRTFTIAGGGLVRIDQRIVNTSANPQQAGLKLKTHCHLDATLAAPSAAGLIHAPLRGFGLFPQGDHDLIAPHAQLTESWFAREEGGRAGGLIWLDSPLQHIEWGPFPVLLYEPVELPPNTALDVPPCWMFAGPGDWTAVRGWWERLARPSDAAHEATPEPERVLSIAADPGPMVLRNTDDCVTLVVQNRGGTPVSGSLTLAGHDFAISPSTLEFAAANRDAPFRAPVEVTAPPRHAAGFVEASLQSGPNVQSLRLPVARMACGDQMEIVEPEPGDVRIDTGALQLRFSTGFFGALTELRAGGENHLLSAFPAMRPFVFANPWAGGVHACLDDLTSPDLAREPFTGARVEVTGERGWHWHGVRMACDLEHKDRSWLRVELDYLALPGGNALALPLRLTNRTDARRSVRAGVAAWCQPGGTRQNTVLHWELNGEPRERRRGGFGAWAESGPWAALCNPETGDSLVLVASAAGHHAAWGDMGEEGMHLQAAGPIELGPNETRESLFWLVHTGDVAKAPAYGAVLSQARRLP